MLTPKKPIPVPQSLRYRPPKRGKRPNPFEKKLTAEDHVHWPILQWASAQYPDLAIIHYPAEGGKGPYEQYKYRLLNAIAGFADLMLIRNGHIGFIEIKAKKGKPSPEQLEFLEFMEANGYYAVLAYEFEGVQQAIKDFIQLSN